MVGDGSGKLLQYAFAATGAPLADADVPVALAEFIGDYGAIPAMPHREEVAELIRELNPVIRGWGAYYQRAHVRRLFNQLDRWIERRLWSHHHKRWRCAGWKLLPTRRLRGEWGLVSLIALIPSLTPQPSAAPS